MYEIGMHTYFFYSILVTYFWKIIVRLRTSDTHSICKYAIRTIFLKQNYNAHIDTVRRNREIIRQKL